ncbi:MAG TPA: tetratricopeptide repeat protein [Silvibacterium sp.]|nr:tetratricopeptide repeat protein [Silvibacterium sp.]
MSIPVAVAQQAFSQQSDGITIQGIVLDSANKHVGNALVRLEKQGAPNPVETRTNASGIFTFSALGTGSYIISAEKSGFHSRAVAVVVSSQGNQNQIDLVLEASKIAQTDSSASPPSSAEVMEFADKPNFTVAGVTDWTAVGGHGSDSILRTSEDLSRETLTLKPDVSRDSASAFTDSAGTVNESESKLRVALASAPGSFETNHQLGEFYLHAGRHRESIPLLQTAYQIDPANSGNEYDLALAYKENGDFSLAREHFQKLLTRKDNADLHRLLGELDEKLGDPLAAVHEDELAVRLDPSEQNYFEWGSELLLHRAVWQAAEVFRNGTKAHPKSVRMLMALSTALFAGALYDEAALRLCDASDLNPADPEPYIFMGKIEMAAPAPLTCVEQKLAWFAQEQPENSLANYLYAMAIWKRQEQPPDQHDVQQVEALLTKAVMLDAKCGDAYLQLGILYFSQRNFEKAIDFYTKAIEVNPQLGEAHYRLGVAYDRVGEPVKARQEFQLHAEIEKQQAAAIEQQRREVKQFLVVLQGQPSHP